MKKIIKIILTILILGIVFYKFDVSISDLYANLQYPLYLLYALVTPLVIYPIISANRWNLFLKQVGIVETHWSLMKINFISVFQGLLLPSSQGQDVLRIYYIEKKHPEYRGKAGSTIIIERMFGFVILCLLSLLFSFIIDIPNRSQIIGIIGIITFALFVIIFLLINKKIQSYLQKLNIRNKYLKRIYDYFEKMHACIAYFPYRNVLLSSIVLIIFFQLSTVSIVYFVFRAYGYDISFVQHISLVPIISILSMIPLSISGLGLREGFFVYFYSYIGVNPEVSVSVSLVYYIILMMIPALIGMVIYSIDIFKSKNIKNE